MQQTASTRQQTTTLKQFQLYVINDIGETCTAAATAAAAVTVAAAAASAAAAAAAPGFYAGDCAVFERYN